MGAADVDGLGDRLGSVRLPRVDRDVDVVVANQLERGPVVLGRVVVLRARQVEPDDAAALVGDRQLRHLERVLGRDVADAADDDVGLDAVLLLRHPQAREDALDHRRELEAAPRVKHRRVADFHVADVLARGVLRELEGDARQRLLGLHDAQGDVERLEVLDERAAVFAEVHRRAKSFGVLRGQVDLLPLGELEDRRQPERPVQVDVEVGLGQLLDQLEGNARSRVTT
jgi:hypothetical protein